MAFTPRDWNIKIPHKRQSNSRYVQILENWDRANQEGKDIIILMDDNIDTSRDNPHNTKF